MKMVATVAVIAMTLSSAAQAAGRVEKFDVNKDGKVSYEELVKACNKVNKKLFIIADDNSDGYLSEREMKEAREYLFKHCKKTDSKKN